MNFHRKPFLMTAGAIIIICALSLVFLNVIAYAQGAQQPPQVEFSALEYVVKIAGYFGLFLGGLAFAVGYVWNLWKQNSIQQEKENTKTWKDLADTRLQKATALEAEKLELKATEKSLRERLRKQKKLILRMIAKLEGEGDEFDELAEDE